VYHLSETKSICSGGSYTFPDGTTQDNITSEGIYTRNLLTVGSLCDSIIVTTVNVITVDPTVNQNGRILTANAAGATYKWLNCSDGNSEISGETNQSFTATSNGSYAVEIKQNTCIVTSSCVAIISVGIIENTFSIMPQLYPNPTEGIVNILLDQEYEKIHLVLKDSKGKTIEENNYSNAKNINFNIVGSPGLYFIEISTPMQRSVFKIVKK
jgi:hypothetical protein